MSTKRPSQLLLDEAYEIISNDRNKQYGSPEENFENIASLWTTYLTAANKVSIVISPVQVAHLMILLKIARLSTNPLHKDSGIDIAGYAACGEDCRVKNVSEVQQIGK